MNIRAKITALEALANRTPYEGERQAAIVAIEVLSATLLAEEVASSDPPKPPPAPIFVRVSEPHDDEIDVAILVAIASLAGAALRTSQDEGGSVTHSVAVTGPGAAAGKYLVREYMHFRTSVPHADRARRRRIRDTLAAVLASPVEMDALMIAHRARRKQAP